MMKKIYLLILLAASFCFTLSSFAQVTPPYPGNVNITSPYFEGFEANPPAFSSTSVQQGSNPWIRSNTLQTEGQWSMKCGPFTVNQQPALTTNSFSTVGQQKVWLYFSHIAKIFFQAEGQIQVSTNNGTTWTVVTSNNAIYQGASNAFATNNAFNELSYADWGATSDVPAQNTWWKRERIDISQLVGNQANVRVRFRIVDNGTVQARDGWSIDSLTIFTAISELDPPVITHTPLPAIINPPAPTNPFPIQVNANFQDETGIFRAWVYYRVVDNPTRPFDSILMTQTGGTAQNSQFRGNLTIPNINDGDTVQYYITATDAAALRNWAIFPSTAPSAFFTFTVGGPPTFVHTPISGLQFSAGPFDIRANILDFSGIDSAFVVYKIGSFGALQRLQMTDTTGNGNFKLVLNAPRVIDGDTVYYHLEARDASPRKNFGRFPATIGQQYNFIASGPPIITFQPTAVLGQQFTLGTFPIRALIRDASRIKEAKVNYIVNGGALQSVNMIRESGTDTFRGIIPMLNDMDSVCYYVSAKDSSIRENEARLPLGNCDRSFRVREGKVLTFQDDFSTADSTYSTNIVAGGGSGWERGLINKSTINAAQTPPDAWVTSLNNDYPNGAHWVLNTPIFNFLNTVGASLSFFQWRDMPSGVPTSNDFGTTDAFYMEYTINNGTTWLRLGSKNTLLATNWYNRSGFASPGFNDAQGGWDNPTNGWERSEIDLSFLNGVGNVQFRFVFKSNSVGTGNGIAIDDFRIGLPLNTDAGLIGVPVPNVSEFIQNASVPNEVVIRNFGASPISNFNVGYSINQGAPVFTNYALTIAPNTTAPNFILPSFSAPAHNFEVCYFVNLPGDQFRGNDTICRSFYGVPRVTVPFSENFDVLPQTFNTKALQGSVNDLQLGTPNKPDLSFPFSPPNAWVTNLTGNHASNMQAALYSPVYSFANVYNAQLNFRQNRNFLANNNGFRISYRLGTGAWTPLDNTFTWAKSNWYNGVIRAGTTTVSGFTDSISGYELSSLILPSLFNNFQGDVQFRVEVYTNASVGKSGLALDDFNVVLSPQQEVAMLNIVQPVGGTQPLFYNSPVEVTIGNFGNDTLYSIPFNYSLNGVEVLPTDFIWNGALAPGATVNVTLPSFTPTPNTNFNLCVYNKLNDAITRNDTLCRSVFSVYEYDGRLVALVNPVPSTCGISGSGIPVRMSIQNKGSREMTNFQISYKLAAGLPVVETYTDTIFPFTTSTIAFATLLNVPIGLNQLEISFDLNGDPDTTDNKIVTEINGTKAFPLNYENTFESAADFTDFCVELGLEGLAYVNRNSRNGSAGALELGTNTVGSIWTPSTIANIWEPNRNQNFFAKAVFQVNTIDQDNLHIRFDLLQISSGANQRNSFFRVVANGQQVGQTFQATANQNYQAIEFDLTPFYNVGEPILIELQSKVEFRSDPNIASRSGNLIDSLVVYNKFFENVGVSRITFDPPLLTPGVSTIVKSVFDNAGVNQLSNFVATLQLNGVTLQTKTFNLQPNLSFNKNIELAFDSLFVPVVGNNQLCVFTSLPNGLQDEFTRNDTICNVFVPFPVIASWPYCNDFEGAGFNWETSNFVTFAPNNSSWEFGTPNQPIINSARSGSKAWMTGLDRDYFTNDSSALYTPTFDVKADSCYKLSFYHRYFISDLSDGGTVEYTFDGGVNWEQLGYEFEPNWYNQPFVSALRFWQRGLKGAGWSGVSQGWEFAQKDFVPQTDGKVIFRFRFGAQAGGSSPLIKDENEGWAIDDFCFDLNSAGNCVVNVPNLLEDNFIVGQNFPNPFNQTTNFNFTLPKPGKVLVEVRDMLGRVVLLNDLGEKSEGDHLHTFQLEQFKGGVYFYTVHFGGRQVTKKMILTK